ncbi:MAG: nucleoside deaminase [Candidatus Diapherotrites archaeon]|nr:nucleoside deaminase [Candidatus Diapherotrites archaeon]
MPSFKPEKKFMLLAIAKAREGISKGQAPFGACIVRKGKAVACEHNMVWKSMDITAHAEIVALRRACKKLKKIDLPDCAIYSTLEPCPMCFSAIHWARIPFIIYGASIADAKRGGFNELEISNEKMKKSGRLRVRLAKGFMKKDCVSLFKEWGARKGKKAY